MKLPPRISIITPSYNQNRYIERTIQSVIEQDYPNLEYIIIDGGSTDNTIDIIKKYEKYISRWISEKDNGQAHAINKGLTLATGEIIAYLNSDDIYLPGAFNNVVSSFNTDHHNQIVYGDCLYIDQNGDVIKKRKEIDFDYTMGCLIGFGIFINQPTVFMRRSVIEKVGLFNEDLQMNMDGEYWFRCAQNGIVFKHIPLFLSGFRSHPDSKTFSQESDLSRLRMKEYRMVVQKSYKTLPISNFIPYSCAQPFIKLYRIKRIILKLLHGCYSFAPFNFSDIPSILLRFFPYIWPKNS